MENQRIRLTKTLLKDALITLLGEKSIDKITVQALCAQAQINRTTFYKYYGSQYDLLLEIENEFFGALERYLMNAGEMPEREGLTQIMEFLASNQDDYRVMLKSTVDQSFVDRLFALTTVRRLLDRALRNQFSQEMADYVYQFLCNGSYAVIRAWLNDGCKQQPAEMADLIYRIGSALQKA